MAIQRGVELDVEYLLQNRIRVHELLSGAPPDALVDRGLVTLALLSTRDEMWAVHVLAAEEALREDTNPAQVIEDFSGGRLTASIEELVPYPEGREMFMASAELVRYAFTPEALAAATVSIPKLEDCLKRDGPPEQILECLRR